MNIEDFPVFTASLFMVYKFYPFILNFLFFFAFHLVNPSFNQNSTDLEDSDQNNNDQEISKFIDKTDNQQKGIIIK